MEVSKNSIWGTSGNWIGNVGILVLKKAKSKIKALY